jgi:catechol-2,3-dioxygenase
MQSRKFDPKVFQLGYVALGTPDIERTKEHYLKTVGMTEVARGDDGSVYLSIGYNHHDLVLRPAEQKTLLHAGFHLKPQITIGDLSREVRELGLNATTKTDSQPGIPELVEVDAPGGLAIQFYSAIEAPVPGFKQTGASPLRLGHVAVISPEGDKLITFFQDFLGFWFTDDIAGIANFLTCNREHHVVNIVKAPVSRVHHIAFELRDNACHAIAADALREAGVPLLWGPSRHTAGHNLASYHHDPDKVMIEFYTEMDQFIPELGLCEPRPWHEHLPMKPRSWKPDELSVWGAEFGFNLAAG